MKDKSLSYPVLFVLVTLFCVSSFPQSPPAPAHFDANLIHFGDLIDVDVVGSFEYDWRGTLTPEGFLDGLDKIPTQIYGLCRSESEIAGAVAKEYGAMLRNPLVVVKILDRSNRAVAFMDGAVRSPQRFQVRRRVFLNELIILSGGITDRSNGEIRIFRPSSLNCGQKSADSTEKAPQNIAIRISDLLAGIDGANPAVFSGDIVTVVEAAPVFLTGGVNVPKQISLRGETTLSRAIAMAGGISKAGIEERVRIFRHDGKESRTIAADLKKIAAKQAEDLVLQAYDVVEVEQKGKGPGKIPTFTEPDSSTNRRLAKLPLRILD